MKTTVLQKITGMSEDTIMCFSLDNEHMYSKCAQIRLTEIDMGRSGVAVFISKGDFHRHISLR